MLAGSFDLGGRRLAYQVGGGGSATVVFECGFEDSSASLAGLAALAQPFARTLLYDRAGLGQSDPAPRPRTVRHAAADLRALLLHSRLPGPYLLVGHSFGGLIAGMYAAQHPAELLGVILLDSPHPQLALRELTLLPPAAPGEPAALTAFRTQALASWHSPASNEEGLDLAASADELLSSPDLGALPLVVITAGLDTWEQGFPPELARALEEDWMRMQREFLQLSRNSRQIIATESNHAIQECQPDLVIEQIRALLPAPQ